MDWKPQRAGVDPTDTMGYFGRIPIKTSPAGRWLRSAVAADPNLRWLHHISTCCHESHAALWTSLYICCYSYTAVQPQSGQGAWAKRAQWSKQRRRWAQCSKIHRNQFTCIGKGRSLIVRMRCPSVWMTVGRWETQVLREVRAAIMFFHITALIGIFCWA